MYTIYKATSPSGRFYIGLTKNSVKARFASHVHRAKTGSPRHPFYAAIRKYGAAAFLLEAIDTAKTPLEAGLLEQHYIAKSAPKLLYNVSAGGSTDGHVGARAFWTWLNANPIEREKYVAKLSATKKANDWSDYAAVAATALAWRKANPKQAYKTLRRASRVARGLNKAKPLPAKTLKEQLLWKHKPSKIRAQESQTRAFSLWARRTDIERQQVGQKISASQQDYWSSISDVDTRRALTAAARAGVNRKKQGAAASVGLKAYWAALKADPVRFATDQARKLATRQARKINANV